MPTPPTALAATAPPRPSPSGGDDRPTHPRATTSSPGPRPRRPRWPVVVAVAGALAAATAAGLLEGFAVPPGGEESGGLEASVQVTTATSAPAADQPEAKQPETGQPSGGQPFSPLIGGDGALPPEGVSPFDDSSAALAGLDPALRTALRSAARAAQHDGVDVVVTSGWRSADYQRALFEEAVFQRGSEAEARRFVLPPQLSSHVSGDAIDIGRTEAAYWFAEHGSDYGLCQVFANEVWHYELATAPGGTCPDMLPDAAALLP